MSQTLCRCGCKKKPQMISCLACWKTVPAGLQRALYAHKRTSPERLAAARECIRWLIANPRPTTRTRNTNALP